LLTGRQQLPPIFSLGYHQVNIDFLLISSHLILSSTKAYDEYYDLLQCRWNYKDERDVATVESMFEQLDYPMDVIWLDIEHTDGKRYFTWDKNVFPNPIEMQQNVSKHGRRMVTIVDPHMKRDDNYHIHKEATQKGLYIKNKDGGDFDGW
jgi:alpha 1,3-glucosidase